LNFEVDWIGGNLGLFANRTLNKNIAVQFSFGVNAWNKQNKKFLKNFGVGLKYETRGQEDLMDIEEDLSEYEYDKL
jgi:hypothetical protein